MRSPPRRGAFEPGYALAKTILIPWLAAFFKWHVEGIEHLPKEGPALIAANHISYFDPLALGFVIHKNGRRPRFLAKSSLFDAPLVGWVLRTAKQIRVDRGSIRALSSMDHALRALEEGEVVVIFPEGTTSIAEDLAPLEPKTGIARLALITGIPVIPCATWGGQWIVGPHVGFKPGLGKEVWVRFGPPVSFEEYADQKDDPGIRRAVSKLVMEEIAVLLAGLKAAKPWQPRPLSKAMTRKMRKKGKL